MRGYIQLIGRCTVASATILALTIVLPPQLRSSYAARSASPPAGTFVSVIAEEPPTLDPHKSSAAITPAILRYIGDPLLYLSLNGKKYVPGLATKWRVSKDGLKYDFTLRKDVKFQDGTALNAAAVVSTYKRATSPDIKSPVAGGMLGPVKTIATTGTYTFRITLLKPFAFLLYDLTTGWLVPLSPKAIASEGSNFGRKPISTGPWMLQSWETGTQITLVRNPKYKWGPSFMHNRGPAHIQSVVFRLVKDEATQTAAFQAGEVDELGLPTTIVKSVLTQHNRKVFKFPRHGVGLFMEFNVTKEPFNDIRVRQAMNYAIDKKGALQIGIQGLGIPACGTLSPSIPGYWSGICKYKYSYNVKKAMQLFKQAGWTKKGDTLQKNGKPFTFTIITPPIDSWTRSATVIQQQLKDVGITMSVQTYDFGTVLKKAASGEVQANFLGYTYDTSHIFFIWFHSSQIGSGLANSHFRSPKLDSMITRMDQTTNNKKRFAIDEEIQKYIANEALWVPLWINNSYIAFQPRVHGEVFDKVGNLYMIDATLKG